VEKEKIWESDGEGDWIHGGRGQDEVEGVGEAVGPASLQPHGTRGELRRVRGPGASDRGWAKSLSEDWDCDGGIWRSGSGGEGGVGHTDHGGGRLSDRGEGQGVGYQSNLRRASGNGGVWGEGVGWYCSDSKPWSVKGSISQDCERQGARFSRMISMSLRK